MTVYSILMGLNGMWGAYLAGKAKPRGWAMLFLGQVLWLGYEVMGWATLKWLIPSTLGYLAVYIVNYRRLRRSRAEEDT
jgi:hypothetical protein